MMQDAWGWCTGMTQIQLQGLSVSDQYTSNFNVHRGHWGPCSNEVFDSVDLKWTWVSAFLISSHGTLKLLVHKPHRESQNLDDRKLDHCK